MVKASGVRRAPFSAIDSPCARPKTRMLCRAACRKATADAYGYRLDPCSPARLALWPTLVFIAALATALATFRATLLSKTLGTM